MTSQSVSVEAPVPTGFIVYNNTVLRWADFVEVRRVRAWYQKSAQMEQGSPMEAHRHAWAQHPHFETLAEAQNHLGSKVQPQQQ